MSTNVICRACGEGTLHPAQVLDPVEHKGVKGTIPLRFSECDTCGAELTSPAEALENKRDFVRFKKSIDGVPLGKDIALMRKRLGISQEFAARIFGGGKVAFSKYENDDVIPDEPMINLLRLAIAFPDTVTRLAELKGIPLFQDKPEYRIVLEIGGMSWTVDPKQTYAQVNTSRRRRSHAVVQNISESVDAELELDHLRYSGDEESAWKTTLQ